MIDRINKPKCIPADVVIAAFKNVLLNKDIDLLKF